MFADLGQKVPGERRNIAGPRAQRRQLHGCSGQRGKQFGQEVPGLDHRAQRQVAGRDYPHINPERMARADRAHIAALDAF